MSLTLKHAFQSTVPEDPNSGTPGGPVGPTEWNAQHTLTQAATTLLGRGENTAGSTEEISLVNDTNVTATLTANTLTLGWNGTLAAARLNSNVVQAVTNDTNVTGTISAQNLTLGWSGTLAAGRLNSNVVQSVVNDTNVTGSIATQALTLGWTGTLAVGRGGTGAGTFTLNGVLYGNTTSALQVTAQGGANTVLTANAGAPSFSASPTIGTSVTTPLLIGGTAAGSTLTLESTSGVGTTDGIFFNTGSQVERMRIDTSGRIMLGGGGAADISLFSNFAVTEMTGFGTNIPSSIHHYSNTNSTDAANFYMNRSRGTTLGSRTIVLNGDWLGGFIVGGADGSAWAEAARFIAVVDGSPSAGSMPGRLTFWTSSGSGATERVRIDNAGVLWNFGAGLGYGPASQGAGGTVTQTTSRTTGVTLNKVCGAITLFAAAPTVGTWTSFTVTNSKVAATDVIILSVASSNAANTYISAVHLVAAGSFKMGVTTVAGTTSDSPVINFAVIKGVTS